MISPEILHDKETAIFQAAIEQIGTKTRDYANNNSDDQNFLEIRGYVFAHLDDTCLSIIREKDYSIIWFNPNFAELGGRGSRLQSTGLREKTDNILEHNRARGLAGL